MANKADRAAFLNRLGDMIGVPPTPETARAVYEAVKADAPALGSSVNWVSAIEWLVSNYEEQTDDDGRVWAAQQGRTWLTYANL
ncbi:hypothetical protein NJL88_09035 [Streptomyces sp. DK15]|uniref:hypothetical protein n=1 Tax=Streptomyces sp. DK15 TaxID=2957499 RepID=UPI0029B464FF|nr:hypothetical protein [Streptomyces sp. DK15]MDX2390208.1 hypothetical protein [Streptomyces sp. DK15]